MIFYSMSKITRLWPVSGEYKLRIHQKWLSKIFLILAIWRLSSIIWTEDICNQLVTQFEIKNLNGLFRPVHIVLIRRNNVHNFWPPKLFVDLFSNYCKHQRKITNEKQISISSLNVFPLSYLFLKDETSDPQINHRSWQRIPESINKKKSLFLVTLCYN